MTSQTLPPPWWHYTPSAEIESAIHLDNLAGDEARLLRGEEAAHARDVVRLRQPPERSLHDGRLLDGRSQEAVIAVSITPGLIAFTRTPFGPSALAKECVSPMMAPLEAT
jgi:hypothetical protein